MKGLGLLVMESVPMVLSFSLTLSCSPLVWVCQASLPGSQANQNSQPASHTLSVKSCDEGRWVDFLLLDQD